jgi:hypothetical protein
MSLGILLYISLFASISFASTKSKTIKQYGHATTTAKVYASQKTSSKVLGSLKNNQNVYIYVSNNGWYQVEFGSKKGWVSIKSIKLGKTYSNLDRDAVMNKLVSNGFYKANTYYATLNPFNPGGSGYTAVSLGLSDDSNMVLEILAWKDPDMPEMNIIPGKVQFVLNQMIPSGAGHIYNIVSQSAVSGKHSELNKVFTYDGLKTKVTFPGKGRPAVRVIFSK